jgi:hypothetical protein
VQLGGSDIERERDLLARSVVRRLDRLDDDVERFLIVLEVRREPALVSDTRRQLPFVKHLLQGVEDLDPHPEPIRKVGRADGNDHVLLEVDGVARVRAAVQDVHHRHRHHPGERAAEVPVERQADIRRGGAGHRERNRKDRVGAKLAFRGGSVEIDERAIDQHLVRRHHALERRGDRLLDVLHGLLHALAKVAAHVAVPQLDRFVLTRGRSARHRSTSRRSIRERDIGLDGRIPTAVEDLAGSDVQNGRHEVGSEK